MPEETLGVEDLETGHILCECIILKSLLNFMEEVTKDKRGGERRRRRGRGGEEKEREEEEGGVGKGICEEEERNEENYHNCEL